MSGSYVVGKYFKAGLNFIDFFTTVSENPGFIAMKNWYI